MRVFRVKKAVKAPLSAKDREPKPSKKPDRRPAFEVVAYIPGMKEGFYSTSEWRKLRFQVLREQNATCQMCGHTYQSSGKPMHVDHAEPRSKRPDLELVKANLQVLCCDCNLGKSATTWHANR